MNTRDNILREIAYEEKILKIKKWRYKIQETVIEIEEAKDIIYTKRQEKNYNEIEH